MFSPSIDKINVTNYSSLVSEACLPPIQFDTFDTIKSASVEEAEVSHVKSDGVRHAFIIAKISLIEFIGSAEQI